MGRVWVLLLCTLCAAQDSVYLGTIGGRVADSTGAMIPGARVAFRNRETNLVGMAETDAEGRFRFPYLHQGPYEVIASRHGFATALRTITLTPGSAFDLPFELGVAASEESITVLETEVLEAARTQVAGTVPESEIRNLPLNGRSFLDVALLIPGVSPANTGSNQLFAETSATPGQGLSISSQRNFSNNFVVDGLSANDDAAGLSGAYWGLDVVDQVQVVTSGGQAEFGRASGGVVNVVTKSGTNTLHGDLYGYFRSSRLNAANVLSRTALPLTQSQYGASIGGPVVRDRTFYFANFEQRLQNQSGLITIAPGNVAAINARLDAVAYSGPRIATGLYSNPVHMWNLMGKVDHQFRGSDQLTLRYSTYDSTAKNQRGAGALSAASASSHLDNQDHTLAASYIRTYSARLLNEVRGQFGHSNLQAPPSDPTGPAVSISGVASFGRLSGSPVARLNKLYEVVDNVAMQAGAHSLRLGGNFLWNANTIEFPRSVRGSYAFSSLANFLNGTYNNQGFTQTFGNTSVAQNNPNLGLYAQEEWKLRSRFTLNLGVRYDLQYLTTIATDTNNISPRGGFAWTPLASRRLVVRGSYGLFYDRLPLRALANALLSAGNTTNPNQMSQISVSLSPAQTGAPVFPSLLAAAVLPPGVLFNFTTMQRSMQNGYAQQGSLEIEQQLGRRATLSVSYQHLRGLHLVAAVNQNAPTCAVAGSNNGCRPNPNYANNSQYSSLGDSHYDGLSIAFTQRASRWGSLRVSYTYSKALNNVGEFFFSQPIDPSNLWRDYGRSDEDQRHRLVADGTLNARWFQLSGMLQYYSALPLNITTGGNTVQGTAARPTLNGVFIHRNAGTGYDFLNLNVRVSRAFPIREHARVEVIAESFNGLNRVNGLTRNGVFGTGAYPAAPAATFGQLTATQEARSAQLALRIGF